MKNSADFEKLGLETEIDMENDSFDISNLDSEDSEDINEDTNDVKNEDTKTKKEQEITEEVFKSKYVTILFLYNSECYKEVLDIFKRDELKNLLSFKSDKVNDLKIIKLLCEIYFSEINNVIKTKCDEILKIKSDEFPNTKKLVEEVLTYKYNKGFLNESVLEYFNIKPLKENVNYPETELTQLAYINENSADKINNMKSSTKLDIIRANLNGGKTGIRQMLDEIIAEGKLNDNEKMFAYCLMLKVAVLRDDISYGIKALKFLNQSNDLSFNYKGIKSFYMITDFISYILNLNDLNEKDYESIRTLFLKLNEKLNRTRFGLILFVTFKNTFTKLRPNDFKNKIVDLYNYYKNTLPEDDPHLVNLKLMMRF